MDVNTDRRTGRSFRTCLSAVLAASERPNQKFFVVFPTCMMAKYHFLTIKKILGPVSDTKIGILHAELPNGSEISCIADVQVERLTVGIPNCNIIYDHVFP